MFAYNVKDFQVSGGPGWANSEPQDIVAKAERNATRPQLIWMLQALRKDRFNLAFRHETKDAPIDELVVAKGEPKIQEDPTSPRQRIAMTGVGKIAQRTRLEVFADDNHRTSRCGQDRAAEYIYVQVGLDAGCRRERATRAGTAGCCAT